ncbi:MAG TPA: malonyl-CoA decarboxylase [Burkholderiales bacterium]|nr:malonyl-CoA decarboxylase [Burkholderiales bacterium]
MRVPTFLSRLWGAAERAAGGAGAHKAIAHCRALLSERGEAAGTALARQALEACLALDRDQRDAMFDALTRDFSPDPERVGKAADAYRREPGPATLVRLQEAAEPPRQELFRRLNMAPGGTAAVVELRRRLLRGLRAHPEWAALDFDLLHLLRSWFNRGFLVLERVDWRTSAMVLEKLIAYEAVHEIKGWPDLRRRLEADRRCFAFFHPALPDEPLIFIEVALEREMSSRVQPLLDVDAPVGDPGQARCAVFYSITNCQDGLRGISFGNFLIKQVAVELQRELPHLRSFATLSPLPGFRQWLERQHVAGIEALAQPGWQQANAADPLPALLQRLCAYYLLHAKQGSQPLDPVARFHLGNGARLERINWLGDSSDNGIARAAGLMVNYVYRLDEVERNHELFVNENRVIASREVEHLARESALSAAAVVIAKA